MSIVSFDASSSLVQTRSRSRSLTPSKTQIIEEARKHQPEFNRDLQPEIGEKPKNPSPPWDDCRLGYRWIPYFDLDKRSWTNAKVGLTPENLLHPRFEDQVMHDQLFHDETTPIHSTLAWLLEKIPRAIVVQDVLVHWQVPDFSYKHSPDIAVYYNYPYPNRSVTQVLVRDWGVEPRLIIEFLSHSTTEVRDNDLVHKVSEYHHVGVPQFIIADITSENDIRQVKIIAYRWQPGKYVKQPLNRRRRVQLNLGDELNVWLGTARNGQQQTLALFDGPDGPRIPTQSLMHKELVVQKERTDIERNRANAAETRATAAEAAIQAQRAQFEAELAALKARLEQSRGS